MNEVFQAVEANMKKALDHFQHELKSLRTGRASIAILDGVMVEYYGNPTPLNQVATLGVPDPHMITAQPWESSLISEIEKGIMRAGLGLNPSNDGKVVRIPLPQLTEERRKELVRKAHDMAESSRNGIRQARREGNESLKKLEKAKEISEDDEHRGQGEVQKLHDRYIADINGTLESKEKDILTV
ncbi:MAG: ribosome recycling factor [Acidobacteriota bacterium]